LISTKKGLDLIRNTLVKVEFSDEPSEKYFENAPKFKSSPQNNGISAALLKQKLCGSGM
jgi:hypothetical protein